MRQRLGLFGGIAVLSCGAVVLQIALTRLYSALFGHHLAFLAISLSLFGVGLGGVLLYVFPSIARPPALLSRLAYLSCLASAATVAALLVLYYLKPVEELDRGAIGRLAILYLTSSLPFVLTGVAVAAAVRHAARDIGRLYLIDLAGAALGGVVAIAALRLGAPRTCLIVAIVDCVAGLAFYVAARRASRTGPEVRASGAVVSAFALAAVVLLAGDLSAPWLKLPALRWVATDKVEFSAWNAMALLTVDKPAAGTAWMRMDGSEESAILDPKTTPPAHPDEMAYQLHKDRGPVLVIGSGGGRDIRAALKFGQKDVYAVEINPVVVEAVMRGRYKAFSGDLYDKPQVHVAIADGRSYVRSSPLFFRNIVISLVDTWAAASVGALALTENSLYTVEAFRDYIDHLEPDGTLLVTRWDAEFDRLLSLAAAGLRSAGVVDPAQHLFACSAARSTALLIKRTPLMPKESAVLRQHCRTSRFVEAFAPDQPRTDLRRRIVDATNVAAAIPESATDLRAPTDDRPFFFYTVPTRLFTHTLRDVKGLETDNRALLTLVGLLAVSVVLAVVFLLGPLVAWRVRKRSSPVANGVLPGRPLLFFSALGAGFVFVEVALVQHFVMFLGHPVYALSTVLVALLLWTGIGSLLTERVTLPWAALRAGRRAQLLVAALAIYAVALGPVLGHLVSVSFSGRLALTLALLAPLGLLMGSQAPLGIKLIAARSPELIPWCWGLNGVASVVATAAGTLLAMHAGFSALLLAGGACYLLAAVAVPRVPEGADEAALTEGAAFTEAG